MFSGSAQQAQCEIAELKMLITELLRSNPGFAEHGAPYIPLIAEEQMASSSRSISSVHTASSVQTASSAKHPLRSLAFEGILGKTRVYRRADRNISTNSFNTIHSSWSQLSGLTLADVSDISVICLPVCVRAQQCLLVPTGTERVQNDQNSLEEATGKGSTG